MSRHRLIVCCIAALAAFTLLYAAEDSKQNWDAVNDAINKGLPKTAIEKLEPIIATAKSEKRYAEAIKAIGMKVSLEGTIQGNKPEEKISRMRTEIDQAPAEMKPMMEAILAHWYWHYFQQNRWRFMQRTQTEVAPSDDMTTWDLPRILSAIDAQFAKTLAFAESLKKTSITDYDELLEKGNVPDTYRPTLFDFVAHNALEFYASGEQAGSRSVDSFDLSADSPIFAAANEFQNWKPDTTDQESLTLKAIAIYQELLRFHQDDTDRTAFLDTDLLRLNFGNNKAVGEEKAARYKAALKRFADANSDHPISSRALHDLAQIVHGEGDLVEARKIASQGLERFPQSIGGNRCYNLIQSIEARQARVATERVWNDPRPTIDVHYRNVTKIYFRLVSTEFEQFLKSNGWQREQLNDEQRKALLAKDAIKSWSVDLPKTEDYRERVEKIPSPGDVPPGSYFLIASHNADFSEQDNQVTFTEIWESNLALVLRSHNSRGLIDGFVLDASSGDPIKGATVKAWRRDPRNQVVTVPAVTTDTNGRFEFRTENSQQLIFLASHKDNSLSSSNYLNSNYYQANQRREQTIFFTDRSIYRPGQTIRYKGICIDVDQQEDNYKTISGREMTVVFADVNGKEIERQKIRTNDYGSFSGSFTAPRDRLMGQMQVRVEGGPQGAAVVTVEEYKRPKFQVELAPPKVAAKLNADVSLQGTATAYTGAAINDAKVSWRVVRQVRYPDWWYWRCWWMPPGGNDSQEIAHGITTTKANGTFDIDFTAKPDASVPEESEPTFQFIVYADVTDTTGETRSNQRTVNVGYTALAASMSAESWLTDNEPVEINILTTTLDGDGQAATGKVMIYAVDQPKQVTRAPLASHYYRQPSAKDAPEPDPSNPNSWPLGDLVFESEFETDASGKVKVAKQLSAGMYRAKLETKDRFGKAVTAELPLQVLDPEAKQLSLKLPNLFATPKQTWEPGEGYQAIWGSGYDTARAFVEVEHRGKLLQSYWTKPGLTQVAIEQQVDEGMRGGFTVRTTMVRENRAYMQSEHVNVPWTNKQLTLKWEHFVSKLEPAAKEKFTAIVSGPDAEKAVAEMVAGMYDASLDAYLPHNWQNGFGVFRTDHSYVYSIFENQLKQLQQLLGHWNVDSRDGSLTYRYFPHQISQNLWGYQFNRRSRSGVAEMSPSLSKSMRPQAIAEADGLGLQADSFAAAAPQPMAAGGQVSEASNDLGRGGDAETPDLSKVSARKNLNETAFFFPHLVSGTDGAVRIEFTMPEALTEWKFLGFAHDNELRAGLLTGTTVTAKDLMVQPNPPRFLREGDLVEFTVKISNQSATNQSGSARLTFADARTGQSVDARLGNAVMDKEFEIPAGESMSLAWRLSVPDDLGPITYKAVGSTGRLSDGEEGMIPVLSRRILVTESLPLPIRGKQSKDFEFTKLLESGNSDTLQHQSVTVQMVSNPSWYAVMALPYLMEYPHECAEQIFNRLYANSIARHIIGSDPKIEGVFEQWRGTPALDSPLEKNQDLKSVMLEESPWYRDAQNESQARRNVGILFDDNRLDDEMARSLHRLTEMQLPDGAWPWFDGGMANDYITLYITTGFGRMRHLGVNVDTTAAVKSLQRLDGWATEQYQRIKPEDQDKNHLSTTIALYLYGRSFFLKDQAVADEHLKAVKYWQSQAKKHWLDLAHRQSQAHLAVALKRFGDLETPQGIMRSIKERSVNDEEMGMFWRDQELSWWWYQAPIETQAMMIEALDEVMNDKQAVEDCKVWLLKQKQTRDWKTTKATADAVYALLLRGSDLLASDALVEVSLGGELIEPEKVEAGTGFYEQRFVGNEIKPELGKISVKKIDEGVAWGSVYWQYLEDMAKITPHAGTPLKLTKQLYVKTNTDQGKVLQLVEGPVEVGDELVVRIVLRTDRDMEYIHLKDYRGSGTEPVNVLSRYKYQDGLAYYESTRDTASHFFIDYLPKGTYVFEYSTRVQLRGEYQTGIANIQCMYAPEFNSHSESLAIVVK